MEDIIFEIAKSSVNKDSLTIESNRDIYMNGTP